jgi:hypothetical protein
VLAYEAQSILLSGLGLDQALVVTGGLAVPGVRVASKVRVAANTWAVRLESQQVGPARLRARIGGVDRAVTPDNRVVVSSPASGAGVQMAFRDTTLELAPIQHPETVTVVWAAVEGATAYQVRDGDGNVLATVPEGGFAYYAWESPALADGSTETFSVRATYAAVGITGTVASRTIEHVTVPRDETEAAFGYNGDGTVDIV